MILFHNTVEIISQKNKKIIILIQLICKKYSQPKYMQRSRDFMLRYGYLLFKYLKTYFAMHTVIFYTALRQHYKQCL